VCGANASHPIPNIVGTSRKLTELINRVKFHIDGLRGFGLAGTQKSYVSIGKHVRPQHMQCVALSCLHVMDYFISFMQAYICILSNKRDKTCTGLIRNLILATCIEVCSIQSLWIGNNSLASCTKAAHGIPVSLKTVSTVEVVKYSTPSVAARMLAHYWSRSPVETLSASVPLTFSLRIRIVPVWKTKSSWFSRNIYKYFIQFLLRCVSRPTITTL
jgi:hypothetical protein